MTVATVGTHLGEERPPRRRGTRTGFPSSRETDLHGAALPPQQSPSAPPEHTFITGDMRPQKDATHRHNKLQATTAAAAAAVGATAEKAKASIRQETLLKWVFERVYPVKVVESAPHPGAFFVQVRFSLKISAKLGRHFTR